MKTIIIKTIIDAIVWRRGYVPATADLGDAQRQRIADVINSGVETAYSDGFFPPIMAVERRQYRATYDATLNYGEDAEVYAEDTDEVGAYYISQQDANVGHDPTTDDGTWWDEVGEDFLRTIDFEQEGETEIHGADSQNCIFDRDPRVYRDTAAYPDVVVYDDSILVMSDTAPVRPWVKFRTMPPEFSWLDWVAGTLYSIDDLVYEATALVGGAVVGQTFKALKASTGKEPVSETEYWEPIDFPRFLKIYVIEWAVAHLLEDDEGKRKGMADADRQLKLLHERITTAQAMRGRAKFSNRQGSSSRAMR